MPDFATYKPPYPITPGIRFEPDRVVVCPGAAEAFRREGLDWRPYLERHCRGDWGVNPYVRGRRRNDDAARAYMENLRLSRGLLPDTPAEFIAALFDRPRIEIDSCYNVGDTSIYCLTRARFNPASRTWKVVTKLGTYREASAWYRRH
jgi:hypothetical protein